jgi:4-amino-4-deoxychorismate lyase
MSLTDSLSILLLETIKIEDGVIFNLDYHQKRCTKSRKSLYAANDILLLAQHIKAPKKGLYRCRIIYADTIKSIEYLPYKQKIISSIKIVPSSLNYSLKYENRDTLNHLLEKYPDVDEIIIEKNGLLTDTSIANIAFYDGSLWYTPATPLLEGTMRQKLIDEGFLHRREIKKEDLSQYTQVALINAMIGFKILNNINIIQK